MVNDFNFDRFFRKISVILDLCSLVSNLSSAQLPEINVVLVFCGKSVCGSVLFCSDNLTILKLDYGIAIKIHKISFVSNKKHEVIPGNRLKKIHNHYSVSFIKVSCRLVCKYYTGILYDCTCNGNTLLLTARKRIRSSLCVSLHTHIGKCSSDARLNLRLIRHTAQPECVGYVIKA